MSGDSEQFVPLVDVAQVGPAGQRIRDAFTKADTADQEARQALWHNNTAKTRTLEADTDT